MSCSFFPSDLISRFLLLLLLQNLLSTISFVSRLINSSTVGKDYLKLLFQEFFVNYFQNCSWKLLVCSWRFVSALWPLLKYKCYLTSCRICAIRAINSWYHPSCPFRGIFHCFTIFFDNFIALFIEMICCYGWKVSAGLGDTKLTIFE